MLRHTSVGYVWANRRLFSAWLKADVFFTLYLNRIFARTKVFAFTSTNFQQWMSRLAHRWRTLRTAIRNANCRIQWVIEILNAYCTFGLCLEVCLYQCPYHKLALSFLLRKVQMLRCLFDREIRNVPWNTYDTRLFVYMLSVCVHLSVRSFCLVSGTLFQVLAMLGSTDMQSSFAVCFASALHISLWDANLVGLCGLYVNQQKGLHGLESSLC